ncbi:hypothetical protein FC678_14100 [Peribacillus simplex]|uniref:Uncharacterized protein n=1 Tax=Peribacillus simplex TaxID=1478 RepID=A0A9X9ES15_9BACI|nr:hypothetical protein [Peribacillus simplex]TKH10668.1 hypothetical protein FC678_14100 [Peribacillus simplex]
MGNVISKLNRLYNVNETEAERLLEGSAFLASLKTDPEYVVNHSTEYWVEELITRKISQHV